MARPAILAVLGASFIVAASSGFDAYGQTALSSSAYLADSPPLLAPAPYLDPTLPSPAPSARPKVVASVPAIDTTNKASVVAAYNAYFNVAQPAVGFTGSTGACNPGTVSTAFQEWMITRINFVRAMAGVPGNMVNDTTKNAQEQAAALIMAANQTLTHSPSSNMLCYTSLGATGAGSSNLAIWAPQGAYDPLMIYMDDDGTGNQIAGHRRWILDSNHASFAVGQATDGTWEANALYAFGQGGSASVPNGIPWPPRGYVPLELFPAGGMSAPRWSFGLPNASFAGATVTMTVNGSPLAVNVVSRTDNGYGDNTIVWELPAGYSVVKGATYSVTIGGVSGVSPTTYTYQVLPFDPADVPQTTTLTVTRSAGSGTITSNPAGVNCGSTCSMTLNVGTSVTLTATPAAGYAFIGWSGACTGLGTCTVAPSAATTVDAKFTNAFGPVTTSLDFGGQSMGTTSPGLPVVVANPTSQAVQVSLTPLDPQWSQTNDCGTSLAAGASCTVSITFSPSIYAGALLSTVPLSGGMNLHITGGSTYNNTLTFTGTAEKSLVSHYYRSLLGRAPDAGGKAFWESEALRVSTLGANVNEAWFALAISFINSPEYSLATKTDAQFVTDLYRTFFNRAPDSGGLGYWTGQLGSGLPREVLLASFLFSPEFTGFTQSIFGNTAVRPEYNMVVDFYRGLLGRLPDNGGFTDWLGRLKTAQCSGASAVTAAADSISNSFVTSPEYASRGRSTAQYVGDLYNAFLRRGGDLAGVQYWIGQIDSGAQTRDQVRRSFVSSPEFQARVQAVIAAGCSP